MEPPVLTRAVDAAVAVAGALGLAAETATVIQDSNKVALRLRPCDVFARVSVAADAHAEFEVELAGRLAEVGSPVAALLPGVEARGYRRDGFEVTLWTFYEPVDVEVAPADHAAALAHLHACMRRVEVAVPHYTDRVASAERLITTPSLTPGLADDDRAVLVGALQGARRAIASRQVREQLLHGEPHPGNVLVTATGVRFVDLETCCRGPVELDLAHTPAAVGRHYPDIDAPLLDDCRRLVLAMVAAWRCDPGDQLPNGEAFGRALIDALRAGPPVPTLDELFSRLPGPPPP